MDYTTLANVKQILGPLDTSDDDLLARLIIEASRSIDRHISGLMDSDDYLKLETVTDELGTGMVDKDGIIVYFPKKPAVVSVSAFAYRFSPIESWTVVDASTNIHIAFSVMAWVMLSGMRNQRAQVKLTYSGGLASTITDLPADIINAADILTVRFYKEVKSGLGDSIGVAELGSLQYTKAIPVRVLQMLKPFKRVVL